MSNQAAPGFIVLKGVRLAFPNLTTARAQIGDDGKPGIPKFDAVLLADQTTDEGKVAIAELKASVISASVSKWADKHVSVLPMLRDQKRLCYNEGPHYDKNGGIRAGWENQTAINVFRYGDRGAPGLFDGALRPLGDDPQGIIYPGCYVNAKVSVFAWDHPKYGKRVRAEILAVMFAREGDKFGGGSAADASGFESLAVADTADTSAAGLL